MGFGATPQLLLVRPIPREKPKRRRQRSVPGTNFALPQERPQAALSITCILSRQMGATDQHGKYSAFHAGLFHCRGFRVCGRDKGTFRSPLDPFGLNTSILDFIRCKGNELPPKKAKNASRQSPCAGEDCRDACISSNYSHAASNASKNSGQDQVPHDAILSFFTVN